MKRFFIILAAGVLGTGIMSAQDPVADGIVTAATVAGSTGTPEDTVTVQNPTAEEKPLWKQKLYYGYNFDIYFHHDSRVGTKENGWSISLEPEIGWKLKERVYLGMRVSGSYANMTTSDTYMNLDSTKYKEDIRVMLGSWSVTPYVRYRMKTLFNDRLGIWLEAHLYTGMDFPRVIDGTVTGTEYDGLKYNLTYGFQVSPVITYRFNRKSTFQIFFSILSLGYSGTTRFYRDQPNEFTNDVIIFSGKLSNLLANQFTPGIYGLKFGIQKNF